MRKWMMLAVMLASLGTAPASADDRVRTLLHFSSMFGVDGPFRGDENPVRELEGDGLAWQIAQVEGTVLTNGFVHVSVRGLVFPNRADIPPPLRGINDEDEFRVIVSCLTGTGDAVTTTNVSTRAFPATRTGNSLIVDFIRLPRPCVAPIVFIVAADEDDWLAVTGA